MAIPEIIEQLAHKVRTEIYGRDVREAIASSMEATAEVAEWSREVAQQIIDGSFDEGALNAEIERKLNELEQEYAPELNELKVNVTNNSNTLRIQSADISKLQSQKLDKSEADIIRNENNSLVKAFLVELDAIRTIIANNYASTIQEGITTGLVE